MSAPTERTKKKAPKQSAPEKSPEKTLTEELHEEVERLDSLTEQYLPLEEVFQTVRDGLQATKCISAIVLPTSDKKGKQAKTKDAGGRDLDFVEVPDNANRLKAADMALKLHDAYPKEKLNVSGNMIIRIHNVAKEEEKNNAG